MKLFLVGIVVLAFALPMVAQVAADNDDDGTLPARAVETAWVFDTHHVTGFGDVSVQSYPANVRGGLVDFVNIGGGMLEVAGYGLQIPATKEAINAVIEALGGDPNSPAMARVDICWFWELPFVGWTMGGTTLEEHCESAGQCGAIIRSQIDALDDTFGQTFNCPD